MAYLGNAYSRVEQKVYAVELLQQSIVLTEELGNVREECQVLLILADIFVKLDQKKSKRFFKTIEKCAIKSASMTPGFWSETLEPRLFRLASVGIPGGAEGEEFDDIDD